MLRLALLVAIALTATSAHAQRYPARTIEIVVAYGEKVTDPDKVTAALARCVKEVRGGRSAILHARVTKM